MCTVPFAPDCGSMGTGCHSQPVRHSYCPAWLFFSPYHCCGRFLQPNNQTEGTSIEHPTYVESSNRQRVLCFVLQELYVFVGCLVVVKLEIPMQSRVRKCPTSVLCLPPLHTVWWGLLNQTATQILVHPCVIALNLSSTLRWQQQHLVCGHDEHPSQHTQPALGICTGLG